jgi:putative copper resistance protein D
MNEIFLAAKTVHILAATTWVGGMIFVAAVLAPKLRRLPAYQRGSLFSELGRRFSKVGWMAIVLLAVSGIIQTYIRAGGFERIFSGAFGTLLGVKLLVVALLVAESIIHDFVLGPKQTHWESRMASSEEPGPAYHRLRKATLWLARTQLLGALVVIVLGVILTRTGF